MKIAELKKSTLKTIFILASVCYSVMMGNPLEAQTGTTNKEKMAPLSIWVGQWKGEGWSVDETRQRTTFTVEEDIQWKLDGRAILAEGIGKNKPNGEVGFHSLGMLYYNNEKGTFEMNSILDDGTMVLARANFNADGQFVWFFDIPGGAKIEYTITLTETTWNEKGAYILPSGQVYPILEMNLTKVK